MSLSFQRKIGDPSTFYTGTNASLASRDDLLGDVVFVIAARLSNEKEDVEIKHTSVLDLLSSFFAFAIVLGVLGQVFYA